MINNNIYQVTNEQDLDEILNDHVHNLTILMFSSQTCSPCKEIKPIFINTARKYTDCFFVYIDINKFQNTTFKYTETVNITPKFSY